MLQAHERLTYLLFCIHALQSLETPVVWAQVRKLVSLPLWHALSPGRLQVRFCASVIDCSVRLLKGSTSVTIKQSHRAPVRLMCNFQDAG